MAPEEGCLVNTWVGRGRWQPVLSPVRAAAGTISLTSMPLTMLFRACRWVLVDLTASAEEWGPHGQAGTKHSLPSVDAFFPSVGSGMGRASSGLDAGSTMPHTRRSLLLVDSGLVAFACFFKLCHTCARPADTYFWPVRQTEEEAEDGELAALESELEFIRYHYRKNCEARLKLKSGLAASQTASLRPHSINAGPVPHRGSMIQTRTVR